MTIEQKARAYDEALEKSKRLYEQGTITECLCYVFPELKESEDERIRKELIKQVVYIVPNDDETDNEGNVLPIYQQRIDKYIAWLEKQGEKEYDWSEESDDDARLNDIVSKVENDLQLNKAEINWLKSIKEKLHKEIHYWTEEEIEPIISDYLRGAEHYGGMIGRLRCLKPKSLEKQAQKPNPCDGCINRKGCINCENGELRETEQKPADKVEPKFKVGGWIINRTDAIIMQVVNNKDFYESVEIGGQRRTDTYNYVEWDFRLWTIQDAKDGDVLAAHECLVLFKEIDGLNIKCYCTYHFMGSNPSFYIDTLQNKTAFYPATEEQRNLLFQKMKEAGYEWDSEKKELKKIEQKSIDYNEELKKCRENPKYFFDTYVKFKEQKPAEWNFPYGVNETADKLIAIAECLEMDEDCLFNGHTGTECGKFLRDLARKQVECRPAEWSEEDEEIVEALNEYVKNLDILYSEIKIGDKNILSKEFREKVQHWLKNLKDRVQPHWKPSDMELEVLRLAAEKDGTYLMGLYEQLKKMYLNYE